MKIYQKTKKGGTFRGADEQKKKSRKGKTAGHQVLIKKNIGNV